MLPIPLGLFGGGIGYPELLLILGVVLLIFGSRLPKLGRWLGGAIVEFKNGLKSHASEDEGLLNEPENNDRQE